MIISSYADLKEYLRADLRRYDARSISYLLLSQPQTRFLVHMRIAEWVHNTRSGLAWRALDAVMRWSLQSRGRRLGYTIPINRFGKGLKLPHWGTIVIGGEATIGDGCTCHPEVMIGTKGGSPVVGDNVYLGNGAKLYGPISVGSNAIIAPNAVVTRDVASGTTVGGIPARVLHPQPEQGNLAADLQP